MDPGMVGEHHLGILPRYRAMVEVIVKLQQRDPGPRVLLCDLLAKLPEFHGEISSRGLRDQPVPCPLICARVMGLHGHEVAQGHVGSDLVQGLERQARAQNLGGGGEALKVQEQLCLQQHQGDGVGPGQSIPYPRFERVTCIEMLSGQRLL